MSNREAPVCPTCSKPIRSGGLALFEEGELFHVLCRSRQIELAAMEGAGTAATARTRAARLVDEFTERRLRVARNTSPRRGTCPICLQKATLAEWRPSGGWMVVEGCGCGDFFVSAALIDARLPGLSEVDRQELACRIRWFRARGSEAWCTTTDGTAHAPLIIRDGRPGRLA